MQIRNSLRLATSLVLLILLSASVPGGEFDGKLFPAFPGAEGAGAYTRGGRGGQVLLVTTLADYDPRTEKPIAGSLRAAVKTPGPRIVLFRVAGNIELKTDLDVTDPYLTLAGQSAPGQGICLRNSSLEIKAPQVIVRYLRVRPGDVQQRELDCISCNEQDVILDHCSASWGIDETISTNGNSANVTVQWCLIAESLNHSVHHKGSHGYGSLISGPGAITYHHNVYAYHRSRNPRPGDVLLDFRNNLIYGWGDRAGYCSNERLQMNYVGNYLRPLEYSKLSGIAFLPGGLAPKMFLDGNLLKGSEPPTLDNWLLIKPVDGHTPEETKSALRVDHAFPTATVTTETASDAYKSILRGVGARLPARDAVDLRTLEQIGTGTGRLIDSQTEVGGWPELARTEPPADGAADGMPDDWEEKFGLNSSVADSSEFDTDQDGYPNLEEFLNGTDPTVADVWIEPPAIHSSAGSAFLNGSTITMTKSTPGGEIRYTLDDSDPTPAAHLYSAPFQLDHSATVRAKTFSGGQASHVRNARLSQLTLHESTPAKDPRPGLEYQYWKGLGTEDFDTVEKTAPEKNGTVDTISLAPRTQEGDFGFRFRGLIAVPADGIYTFTLRCSPPGLLVVDGQEVVVSQGRKRERSGKIALKQGLHPLAFEIYYSTSGDKTLELDFAGPGIARQSIAATQLFHVTSGATGPN